MKKIIILIIIVLVLCSPLYSGETKSVTVETVKINWQIDGDNLIMELTAPTEGWISIGFNPSSKMKDANIIIGCVDGSGSPIMEDHFGTSPISHKSDSDLGGTGNITIISGKEMNKTTTLKFSIPLNSGDSYDTILVPGKTTVIIIAYGTSDNFSKKHSKRYKAEIVL